jgi:hypothetical protein
MKPRNTIIVLLGLTMIFLFFTGSESYQLFHGLRHLSAPTHETREPFGHNVHGWMSIEEIAKTYSVSPADVFMALDIVPAPGDEKLTLKALADKYHKTTPEIEDGLNKLNSTPSKAENDGE